MYHGILYFQRYSPAALLPRSSLPSAAPSCGQYSRHDAYDASVAIGITHDESNENSCAVRGQPVPSRRHARRSSSSPFLRRRWPSTAMSHNARLHSTLGVTIVIVKRNCQRPGIVWPHRPKSSRVTPKMGQPSRSKTSSGSTRSLLYNKPRPACRSSSSHSKIHSSSASRFHVVSDNETVAR